MKRNIVKDDWYVWGEWPGIPWFHSCYIFGLALELKKRSGFSLSKFAIDIKDNVQKIYLLKHEWQEGGEWYLQQIIKNTDKLEKDLIKVEQAADALLKLNKELFSLKADKLSTSQLSVWCDKFHKANHELWSAGMVPNLLELNQGYLSAYLRKYIENTGKITEEEWQTLIAPTALSQAQIEELLFLKMVVESRKEKRLLRSLKKYGEDLILIKKEILKFPKIRKALENHYKKFCWLQYGWTGPASSLEYYLDIFSRFVRQGEAEQLLVKAIKHNLVLKQNQKQLEKKFISGDKHKKLFSLLRRLLFGKAHRMDAFYQGYYAIEPVLRASAKYFGISMSQLYMIYGGDLPSVIKKGKCDIFRLNESLKYSAYIKEGNGLNFYLGAQAKKKMAPVLNALPKIKMIADKITGECAYPGKARGRVKIIANIQEEDKFEKGDILVSYATDPSLLPMMKKAAAFITDMGGLTCHAAIVAREMKKPCIVGTKIATKVLKDGDLVEIDAEKGIVRKINKS